MDADAVRESRYLIRSLSIIKDDIQAWCM